MVFGQRMYRRILPFATVSDDYILRSAQWKQADINCGVTNRALSKKYVVCNNFDCLEIFMTLDIERHVCKLNISTFQFDQVHP
jgi:hypothetical protein